MRILIAAKYVSGNAKEGGSSRFFGCLSDAFMDLGHEVFKTTNDKTFDGEAFDVVVCSHFVPHGVIGRKIYISHGIIGDEIMKPGADDYISVSEEVQSNNRAHGFESRVLPQPIAIPHNVRPINDTLKNILVIRREPVSNDPFAFLSDRYNLKYSDIDAPIEEQIEWADLCVTLGRGALESMAYGRPVIVADNRPYIGALGDGYVDEETADEFEACNFSGRFLRVPLTQEWILSEIEKYNPDDAVFLADYIRENHDHLMIAEDILSPELKISFGVMVNDKQRVNQVLSQSQFPPSTRCHSIGDPDSAAKGINKLLDTIEESDHPDIAIITHQDMYYDQNWLFHIREQIKLLPDDWMVAGIIGKDLRGRICGHLHDTRIPLKFYTNDIHSFPQEACCFDECCIIIRMDIGFRFQEWLDGFDLYGTLAVLQAEAAGGSAWILDAFASHHCMRPFTWHPDELFCKNFKELHKKFPDARRIDSTVIGVDKSCHNEKEEIPH